MSNVNAHEEQQMQLSRLREAVFINPHASRRLALYLRNYAEEEQSRTGLAPTADTYQRALDKWAEGAD